MAELRALLLNCSIKPSREESSSDLLATEIVSALAEHDVESELVRVVDHGVRFGVTTDEGNGDGWPPIREKLMASDILVLVTPTWMGQPSSVAKMVLERLDAELGEVDDEGRMSTFGKVAGLGVVGNEDGAHHVSAEVYQALNDTGFSLAPNTVTYWVGEAMSATDYKDKNPRPEKTQQTTHAMAGNTDHLARLLKDSAYPPQK